jgi:hypothetical protein
MDQARSVTATFSAKPQPLPIAPVTAITPAEIRPKPPKLIVSHRRLRLKDGRALIELRCVGVAGQSCEGTLVLRSIRQSSGAGSGGTLRFTIPAGKRKTLAASLPSPSKLQLAGSRKAFVLGVIALRDGSVRQVRLTLIDA